MKKSRIDLSINYDLKALIDELEGLWVLSSPIFNNTGLIPFVTGLIFSERILQVIEDNLSNYHADWGQIIDGRTGNYLSKECDIIIYNKRPIKSWGKKTIRFIVVENINVDLVIQCCKNVTTITKEHEEYPRNIKKFVSKIWYLAECYWGSKRQCDVIENRLRKCGYDKFFYLYRKFEKGDQTYKELNYTGWKDFIKSIRQFDER